MKKILALMTIMVALIGITAGCQSGETASGETTTEYILADLPNDGGQVSENTKLIVEEMNKALEPHNAHVTAVVADDYSAVSEAILTGTAHIGTPSGATYTKAHLENENVIPLFIQAPNGVAEDGGYPAYIGTHIDNKSDFEGLSKEEALKSLKGKSFSFVSATSTSGRLVPTTVLYNTFGPDGTGDITTRNQVFEKTTAEGGIFSEIQFGGSHPASVELIVNKKVYAGAFCCNYADDYKDKLYIISETLVPNGPYWVNKDYMKQEHINALVEHFTNLTPDNAVAGLFSDKAEDTDAGALEMTDRFVAVEPSFYNFLEVMYAGE